MDRPATEPERVSCGALLEMRRKTRSHPTVGAAMNGSRYPTLAKLLASRSQCTVFATHWNHGWTNNVHSGPFGVAL